MAGRSNSRFYSAPGSTRSTNEAGVFECLVCFEELTDDIYQCPNGHLFCQECIPNFKKCPTCNVKMNLRIRNRALEKMIAKPVLCPNKDAGCGMLVTVDDLETHCVNECHFVNKLFCTKLGIKCEESMKLVDLAKHLVSHGVRGCSNYEMFLRQGLPTPNLPNMSQSTPVVLFVHQHVFVMTSHWNAVDKTLSWMVRVAASDKTACNFIYKVQLVPGRLQNYHSQVLPTTSHKGTVFSYKESFDNVKLLLLSMPIEKLRLYSAKMSGAKGPDYLHLRLQVMSRDRREYTGAESSESPFKNWTSNNTLQVPWFYALE